MLQGPQGLGLHYAPIRVQFSQPSYFWGGGEGKNPTDAIQFQVYDQDDVTTCEILSIQNQDVAKVIYILSVFLQVSNREALNKNVPITFHSNMSYLQPSNSAQGRATLWSPYYITSPH
jgi:hypothetical protein